MTRKILRLFALTMVTMAMSAFNANQARAQTSIPWCAIVCAVQCGSAAIEECPAGGYGAGECAAWIAGCEVGCYSNNCL